MATSPSQQVDNLSLPPPAAEEAESPLSSLIYDLSQHVQMAMENMLKMINEIDQNSSGILEDVEKCKDSALERKKSLEEEKERFQKAAFTVLDMLNSRE
ncbi:Potassium channel in 3 [Hibiscus syriacus]|uniref:Potassium channel in 3 n=1 Tax=Hibiscus syriacus TaxID=106335 RepID=A0A6A3C3E2_HIBSY|nr:Potassium channel in 3 [Hibiscus syriacus]